MRPLSAVDHARIRLQLVLIPVWLWLIYGWRDLLLRFPLGLPGSQVQYARDFIQFYIQGVMAKERNAAGLYDIDVWTAMIPTLVPGATDLRYPPIYGPQMSVLFSPLASFSYGTAMAVWVLVSIAIYLGCGYAMWKACPRLRDRPWMVALLLLADPGLHFTLAFVQVSPIGLLCVTGAYLALRAGRPFLAGLAVGALVYKPQLGLAAAFIFVFAREWRIVAGAVTGAALELAGGCLYWGPSILSAYVQSVIRLLPQMSEKFEPFRFHMHSWRGFFDLLGLPGGVAMAAYAIVAAIILIVAIRCWRSRGPLAVRYSVFLVATVLVDPHLYVYDFILLVPGFLLLWDWTLGLEHLTVGVVLPSLPLGPLQKRSFSASCRWLLYFCYFSPLFTIVALILHVQLSVLALTLLGLLLAGFLLSASREPLGELAGAAWNPSNLYGC